MTYTIEWYEEIQQPVTTVESKPIEVYKRPKLISMAFDTPNRYSRRDIRNWLDQNKEEVDILFSEIQHVYRSTGVAFRVNNRYLYDRLVEQLYTSEHPNIFDRAY